VGEQVGSDGLPFGMHELVAEQPVLVDRVLEDDAVEQRGAGTEPTICNHATHQTDRSYQVLAALVTE
jgi:hypothetical protein